MSFSSVCSSPQQALQLEKLKQMGLDVCGDNMYDIQRMFGQAAPKVAVSLVGGTSAGYLAQLLAYVSFARNSALHDPTRSIVHCQAHARPSGAGSSKVRPKRSGKRQSTVLSCPILMAVKPPCAPQMHDSPVGDFQQLVCHGPIFGPGSLLLCPLSQLLRPAPLLVCLALEVGTAIGLGLRQGLKEGWRTTAGGWRYQPTAVID